MRGAAALPIIERQAIEPREYATFAPTCKPVDKSTAAHALFHNLGSTTAEANGGDTAFDGTASADHGQFHNYASTVSSGRGGVTSFNNNCPQIPASQGASAGNGHFHNYGAGAAGQGGGHVYFESVYGSPTAARGTFINHGSAVSGSASNVGRTVFSISAKPLDAFCPTAGNATFWNLPGTGANAPGGLTQFTISPYPAKACYGAAPGKGGTAANGPTAGSAMIINMGAVVSDAQGGQTLFNGTAGLPLPTAGSASMLALGGVNGGAGGSIVFAAYSSGGSAKVGLNGNGTLDVSGAGGAITLGTLDLAGGVIKSTLGTQTTSLVVSGNVTITVPATFSFVGGNGFATNTPYTVLTGANLSSPSARQFSGNKIGSATPTFTVVGNSLQVTFN